MKKIFILLAIITSFHLKIQSQAGASLDFDGIDDFVDLPFGPDFDIASTHIKTVQLWFKNSSNQGNHVRLFSTGGANWMTGFWIGFAYGSPFLKLELSDGAGTGVSLTGTTPVRGDNAWHQASAVFNGTLASLYLDGASQGTVNISAEGAIINSGGVNVGADMTGEALSYFEGAIDELRVWDRVLCQAEIAATMHCELTGVQPALAAYYKFNEGTAGGNNASVFTVPDFSTNGNTGYLVYFALSGNTSNWASPGAVTSGSACATYVPGAVVTSPGVCSGQTVMVTASGGNTYTWMPGNLHNASITISPSVNTVYTITSSDCLNNSLATVMSTISVKALPVISVLGNTLICPGQPTSFTVTGADTYSWSTGVTTPVIIVSPSITTVYSAKGTSALTGCSKTTSLSLQVDPCTGTENREAFHGLMLYPNPGNGDITIELENSSIISIEARDYTGKLVYSTIGSYGKCHIDLNGLSNGLYYVTVQSDNTTKTIKVIKEGM